MEYTHRRPTQFAHHKRGGYNIKIVNELYKITPLASELKDYKFFCFNGEPRFVKVDYNRFTEHHANYYDLNWNLLPFGEAELPPQPEHKEEKPLHFNKMVDVAKRLAYGHTFLRVDLYNLNGKIHFGELTFFPASGLGKFTLCEFDSELGKLIRLPNFGRAGGGKPLNLRQLINVIPRFNNQLENDLDDYKFYCFNGKAEYVMVCTDRASGHTKFYFFNRRWELCRINQRGKDASANFTLPKPPNIEQMFDVAEVLSRGIPHVRVDLYNVNGHIYFGELTFYSQSGFDKGLLPETDLLFGSLIDCNVKPNKQ